VKRKFYRHLLFWVAYCIQGAWFEYAWIHDMFAANKVWHVWGLAFIFSLAVLPAKMALAYYVMEYSVNDLLVKKESVFKVVSKLVLAVIISIFIYRLARYYIVNPLLYPTTKYVFSDNFGITLWLSALFDIGYVAAFAVSLKLLRMQIGHLQTEKFLVKDKLETELKFLKNQINPHFLFNTLNNIYGLARKKSDQTPDVVMKLSKLLRFMLYESGKEAITIADEIRILEDYLELERIRYNNRLKISFDKEVDDCQQRITPLILLPFVENAFKHGLNETTGNTGIDIKLRLKEGRLNFKVYNTQDYNGDNTVTEKIGLSNVRRQLELMYKDFSLQLDNLSDSFNVDLQVNLNSHATI
jgi:two-component system LytT family sensor kinase